MGNGTQSTGQAEPKGRPEAGAAPATSAVWSLQARGDIDVDHAPALAVRLDDALDRGAKVVVLDLSGASFLDSSGLRVIVRAGERLREHDGQLIIEGASGAVSRVLEVTGLLEHYSAPPDGPPERD
jgi:anti-sigma B factor antagonist